MVAFVDKYHWTSEEVSKNERFDTLKIDREIFNKFTPLFKVKRSLMSSDNSGLDNDSIFNFKSIKYF